MSFNKTAFLKQNILNKKPFSKEKGLFVTELTVKENDIVHSVLTANGITSTDDENKIIVDGESYINSIYTRLTFGLVDKEGEKIFSLEEVELLKDKDFVDQANLEILEINKAKK